MPSSTYKSLTRKKKAAQQFRRGSKTFRHKKNLRQKISAKKLYTKDKKIGKRFTRVARGFVDDLRAAVNHANKLEETDTIKELLNNIILSIEREERDRENIIRDNECALCMVEMKANETTQLICGHKFHTDCLNESLRAGFITCPLCRGEISDKIISSSQQSSVIIPYNQAARARAMLEEAIREEIAAIAEQDAAMDRWVQVSDPEAEEAAGEAVGEAAVAAAAAAARTVTARAAAREALRAVRAALAVSRARVAAENSRSG